MIVADMKLDADIREYIARHRVHGPLTGDATEPTHEGYMVEVGRSLRRRLDEGLTPEEAAREVMVRFWHAPTTRC
jgi:hypothetical protein